jgi:hypothetical protein
MTIRLKKCLSISDTFILAIVLPGCGGGGGKYGDLKEAMND